MWDVHLEPKRFDLWPDGELRLGVAVDEEDGARIAGGPGLLAGREVAQPVEQLRLVGVRREAADRADAALDLARLPVEADRSRAGLEVRAERALALVADEQDRRVRIADEVAQVVHNTAAREHPIRGHDHVRPLRGRDRLRRL